MVNTRRVSLTLLTCLRGLAILLLPLAQAAWCAEVQSVRISSTPAATRVVFDVSKPVQYEVTTLDNPLRIVIDMRDTALGTRTDTQRLRIAGTPLVSVRSAPQPGGSLRWVLELRAASIPRSFALPPVVPYGHRLVVDLLPAQANTQPIAAASRTTTVPVQVSRAVVQTGGSVVAVAPAAAAIPAVVPPHAVSADAPLRATPTAPVTAPVIAPVPAPVTAVAATPVAASQVTANRSPAKETPPAPRSTRPAESAGGSPGGSPIVFAIDAGHGGQDPGALGPDGIREKDVVLATAKRLAELINAEPGFKAILTRTGDYFIPLRERPRLARAAGAHFFVSVHADAHSNADARGASVYALSERGATSETAKWLAERENNSDLVGGVSLDDKDRVLAEVLLDLSMTASLTESLELGGLVLSELNELTHLHSRRVEQAGFMVLKSPDIPSILIETGYVSNPVEAGRLANPEYREKLARAIFRGLTAQALRRPPQGTAIAARGRDQPAKAAQTSSTEVDAAAPSRTQADQGSLAALASVDPNRAYVVAVGDTLRTIAERFGVSLRVLRRLNGMRSDRVRVGQTLRLPRAGDES